MEKKIFAAVIAAVAALIIQRRLGNHQIFR